MNGLGLNAACAALAAAGALFLCACSSPRVTQTSQQPASESAPASDPMPTLHERSGGPPSHARAHGLRTKHRFNYYPSADAYHDCETGAWFWFESGAWKSGVKLPRRMTVRGSEAISVALDARTPYDDPNTPAARAHITHGGASKHSIQDY